MNPTGFLTRVSLHVVCLVGIAGLASALPAEERPLQTPEEAAPHPGVYDQWLKMKGIDQRVVSAGLQSQWYRHDQEVRTRATPAMESPFSSAEYLGPADVGGRTRALLIDRNDCDRVFAGAISGGLWYSGDRARTWSAIDDAAASLAVSGITQSPFDHNRIYYCTGEARANTAGVSGDGLFKSVDGGRNFVQLHSTAADPRFDFCWCVQHSRSSRNTLYVGTELGGLMRSTDGGGSWSAVLSEKPVTDVICLSGGEVLAAVSGGGIYRSPSGRAGTFARIDSADFPADFQRIEIAECAAHSRIVYAAFESPERTGGVIRFCASDNGGRSWTQRETPGTGPNYDRYCFMLAVHPCDPNLLVCGGKHCKFSRDGGMTWPRAFHSHNDYHTVATFHDETNRFLIGNDGGVYQYRWSNPRADATDRNDGYHVTQFYAGNFAPTGSLVIGGTQDNGTCKLDATTRRIFDWGDGTHCHISLQDPDRAYAGAQGGQLFRFDDFLSDDPTWMRIDTNTDMNDEGYQFLNPFQVNRVDGQQLYARTDQAIWRTLDGGDHWTRLSSGVAPDLYAIACSDNADPILYYGGGRAQLFRIDHAASAAPGSEQELSETAPAQLNADYLGSIAIDPDEQGTILVSLMNFAPRPRLWKVSDADTAAPVWTNVSGDLPASLPVNYVQIDPADTDQSYFAATDFGLYFTRDGGLHWFKETRIPSVSIHEIKIRASDRSLFAFTHGRGVWKLALE